MPDRQAFAVLRDELSLVSGISRTDDAREGVRAFTEGRRPRWTGR